MNRYSKIFSAIVLIMIFNLPFICYVSIYNIQKLKIRDKIESELKFCVTEDEIIELTFTREQSDKYLTWLSKREFKYADLIYQVVKVKYSGDKIIYYCRLNIETLKMVDDIDNLVGILMGRKADIQSSEVLLSFIKGICCDSLQDDYEIQLNDFCKLVIFGFINDISIRYIDVADPPPKFIIC